MRLWYDPDLPITAYREEILAAMRDHQVVVVAGETGSGKTTQLPKLCLDLGRGSIGHTQPRRIAARSVAERLAEELQTPLGDLVGYQVRFTRRAGRDTRVKVMTDGVLLAEIGHDRDLRRYDTVIVDEAHERSLNIDFLLGYLKQLLTRRDDLSVIITSATIDTERFAAHFADPDGRPAPVIQVSGRSYPVEVRYRPLLEDGEADLMGGVVTAVRELQADIDGDILVFLSGEREIRDAADALAGARLRFTEVIPLFARLSAAEQHRVFAPHSGRRVVLATNIAETSLTVPGIRAVVDAGTARVSRYSARTKVQRLPIEPISRASADQRAGRCGRVAPGICVRLYAEEDYAGRTPFTEPEILRTNVAAVILQMTAAGLGAIEDFPFVESPDRTQVTDGLRLLDELGALDPAGTRERPRLTEIGRRLARIPVDPRMGRMLLAGERLGCLRELTVIVSGLSIQDPRERPAEHRERADALHRRFFQPGTEVRSSADPPAGPGVARGGAETSDTSPQGDFVALLNLWAYITAAQSQLSGNAFRRLCRDEYLHYLRIREWQDLHGQLKQISRDLGLNRNEVPATVERVHTAALAGLLSHVGLADSTDERSGQPGRRSRRPGPREYLGARGTRFAINRGSSLARAQPPLVMAAEIVETSRLWARTVAEVSPDQVEEVGQHLLKRSYSEPHWSTRSGSVLAYEQVTLYGIPIVAGRRVGYGAIDPVAAREIFIRAGLVEGRWRTRHRFLRDNDATRRALEALEERTRRRDLLVDDETVFAFYDERVPADVVSAAHFDSWWKHARQRTPDLLTMTEADLAAEPAVRADPGQFPDAWLASGHRLALSYRFAPGSEDDGVTAVVALSVLNQITPAAFSWQVPGLRTELTEQLIRALPKHLRRLFVPVPEYAARALAWLEGHPGPSEEGLTTALSRALRALTGEVVGGQDWSPEAVPLHLQMRFEITDDGPARATGNDSPRGTSRVVASGRDLALLKQQLSPRVTRSLDDAGREWVRRGLTTWAVGELPRRVELATGSGRVVGFPALVDEGSTVSVRMLDSEVQQGRTHALGLRRLVSLNTPDPTRWVVGHMSNATKLALAAGPYRGVPELLADARLASVGELIRRNDGGEVRDARAFAALCDLVRTDNPTVMRDLVDLAGSVIVAAGEVRESLAAVAAVSPAARDDLAEQIGNLVFDGFLSATEYAHLQDLPRYLSAARHRIRALLATPARDEQPRATILRCEDAYAEVCALAPPGPLPDYLDDIGWLLEELRVSLFAQQLRTKLPVSEKRVQAAVQAARTRLLADTAG